MTIGMVGCGKLGFIVALAIESRGHKVLGFDINPKIADYLREGKIPFKEEYSEELLKKTKMRMVGLKELVDSSDIIFLAVQTPHDPKYEGVSRLPKKRVDFDYSYLKKSVKEVNALLTKDKVVVIISTVLPGTIDREIRPLLGEHFKLVYEPLFIAMGTVYDDYLNPEFVLVGVDEEAPAKKLEEFLKTLHKKPIFKTNIKTAEAIKVLYNTFITTKIVLANTYGELAYKTGANVDDIYKALCLATDRLLSPKYLKAGMGDGGGCHPRDNIALSFLAKKIDLSFDIFESLMIAREEHTEWLADLIIEYKKKTKLPVYILGKSFKPETNIVTGSPAMLLASILKEKKVFFEHYDPSIDSNPLDIKDLKVGVYFIATEHSYFKDYKFPKGSVVIDPFRYISKQDKLVKVVSLGK